MTQRQLLHQNSVDGGKIFIIKNNRMQTAADVFKHGLGFVNEHMVYTTMTSFDVATLMIKKPNPTPVHYIIDNLRDEQNGNYEWYAVYNAKYFFF